MKIKRNINGQEMEFELTVHELMMAYEEYQLECMIDDVRTQCEDDDGNITRTDKELEKIAKRALRYLHKNDNYFDAYWDSVYEAVEEFV